MGTPGDEGFPQTERFSVRRRLGAGAYGVVYEAFDREREVSVALKTLRHGNVDALYRLKREFRALADIAHPNLATLYEMFTSEETWFFTMELVAGVNFLRYVRSGRTKDRESVVPATTAADDDPSSADAPASPCVSKTISFDPSRLRDALRQAASGIAALHEAGKLHRDIKPSNVLVTPEGRVVMLDFGLVTELDPFGDDRSLSLVGTPAYMSPEQGSRVPVSEKSDWYSMGVMLYEALTDRQPFSGAFAEMMWEKQRGEPESPRAIRSGVPEDLNALCMDLLRRDPNARPTAAEILVRLGAPPATAPWPKEAASLSLRPGPFVGRHAHLAALRDAFEASRRGQAVSLYVHGTSGIGKSALVRRFLDELRGENAVILSGRCYERESMPYKALDTVVDSLSQYLKRLPAEQVEGLLPLDVLALARVFPVLRRVEAVTGTPRKPVEIADSLELRRRAFAALRELFARLSRQRDVVLFIDDLQWGDADSAVLLEELTRPPEPPALLVIACYRSEEAATSPLLKRLLARPEAVDVRQVAVEELEPSEARELVLALADAEAIISPSQAETIAREAAGNPFFINELARFGRLGSAATLDELVRARVRDLPPKARRLLEVVAVAGRPVEAEVAARAAGAAEGEDALPALRAGHLVRARGTAERQEIESYHDRIREAVVAQIPSDALKEHHRRLAVALETSSRADPEELSLHFQEAGDTRRAAEFAVLAAERAAQTLAFDRASRLYRMAIELGPPGDASGRRALNRKLGDALVNAGRGAEAAKAFLAAADGADRADALRLEGHAAAQLLRSGHLDEALPLYEKLTGRVGLSLIQPSWLTLLRYLTQRAIIRLRGIGYRERDVSRIPPEELIRLDTVWSLFTGIILVNSLRGRQFQSQYLLLALEVGEPYRASLAITWEAGYAATPGWHRRARHDRMMEVARRLAERLQNPHAIGTVHMCRSAAALFLGRWRTSWEEGRAAGLIFEEKCTGVSWELDFTHIVPYRALFYLGGLRELSLHLPGLIREALQRDDLMMVATLRIRHAYLMHLAVDDPDTARANLRDVVDEWSHKGFHNQHYWALIADAETAIYRGEPIGAREQLENQWQQLKRSRLLRFQLYRVEALHVRARSALALTVQRAETDHRSEALLRSVNADANRIEREVAPWASPLAGLLRAGLAAARRNDAEVSRLLLVAEDEFRRLDMALYAAVAQRRRGELLGGDQGKALAAAADAWMAAQDIKNPERMADMLAPGRWS